MHKFVHHIKDKLGGIITVNIYDGKLSKCAVWSFSKRIQREAGNSFVSRTVFMIDNKQENEIVVLRCVVMNPMTDMRILNKILDEQEEIYKRRQGG